MLTSGTTGTPKGAMRTVSPRSLAPLAVAGFLDLARIKPAPRSGEPFVVAPPLFHLYGLIGLIARVRLRLADGDPPPLRRRGDARADRAHAAPACCSRYRRCSGGSCACRRRPAAATTRPRCGWSSAAPRRSPPELATAVMDEFGDVLYNGYASTEVGSARSRRPPTCGPRPGTVGRPMARHHDQDPRRGGHELPRGETGRIFVGSPLMFEGYTGGGGKQVIDGLMSTGDVGHFDDHGRLFIDGRDDDMILSGGENVFPQEVEDLLIAHERRRRRRRVRRPRQGLRPAPCRVRRASARRRRLRGRAPATTSASASRATRSRARSRSSTSCRAPRPASSSAASSASCSRREAVTPREPARHRAAMTDDAPRRIDALIAGGRCGSRARRRAGGSRSPGSGRRSTPRGSRVRGATRLARRARRRQAAASRPDRFQAGRADPARRVGGARARSSTSSIPSPSP